MTQRIETIGRLLAREIGEDRASILLAIIEDLSVVEDIQASEEDDPVEVQNENDQVDNEDPLDPFRSQLEEATEGLFELATKVVELGGNGTITCTISIQDGKMSLKTVLG